MYHAACKVEFQPFKRSNSQLTFFNFLEKIKLARKNASFFFRASREQYIGIQKCIYFEPYPWALSGVNKPQPGVLDGLALEVRLQRDRSSCASSWIVPAGWFPLNFA